MAQNSIGDLPLREFWSRDHLGHYGEDPDKKLPFQFHIFPNLLDRELVTQLREDVNSSVKLKLKDNDLYKFKQSKDLKTEVPAKKLTPLMHEFIDVMMSSVREKLEKITGLKLSSKNFDITISRYDVGNYLLCHNDDIKDRNKLHGRALAFIYYLNNRLWTDEDGGALAIYDSDSTGEPVSINNRIFPKPNTLVVFNTSPISWHSVQEVHCKDDFRLSINGWYHVDRLPKVKGDESSSSSETSSCFENSPYEFLRPITLDDRLEKFFKECFNPEYLMDKTCTSIRKKFKKQSEINLTNFLLNDKFAEINQALKDAAKSEENLVHVGPYNKRNYHIIKLSSLPQICRDLYDAFRSELFFMFLSRLTGLDLQPPSLKHESGFSSGEDEEEDEEDEDSDSDDDDQDETQRSKDDSGVDPKTPEKRPYIVIKKEQSSDASIKTPSEGRLSGGQSSSFSGPTTSKDEIRSGDIRHSRLPARKRKRISDPLARLDFRHLQTGSYTLIHDYAYELAEKSALDVMLHFNHEFEVDFEKGGYISYIDGSQDDDLHDMDCELLSVEPKSNCLSLVYRCDVGTCRFLKHISKAHESNYQDLYCVYYERSDDLPKRPVNIA